MNVTTLIYRSEFSVLLPAAHTYLTALVAIAQTVCVEIAECTMQTGYDRADWFYGAWATVHYSEMPALPEVERDFWLEPLEVVAIATELTPLQCLLRAPQSFQPFGLLPAAPVQFIDMTIRELRAIAKERKVKKYGSLSKAKLLEVLAA